MHILGRERKIAVIVGEIVTVDIIDVAVAVIINSVSRYFSFVYPHVRRQVFVVVFDTLVDYGYDDIRNSCA